MPNVQHSPDGSRHIDGDGLSEIIGGQPSPHDATEWQVAGYVWTLLPRPGKRPIWFLGREMLHANNCNAAREGRFGFWSDVQLFELYSGGFVISVRHVWTSDDRTTWHDAWFSADAKSVVMSLRNHGSAGAWPEMADGTEMAARLQCWLALVRDTFADSRPA